MMMSFLHFFIENLDSGLIVNSSGVLGDASNKIQFINGQIGILTFNCNSTTMMMTQNDVFGGEY